MKKNPVHHRHEDLRTLLHAAGYKATPARLSIVDLLKKNGRPMSTQEIQKKLPRGSSMDQTTVYRVLQMLQTVGIVRSVDLRQGRGYYELHDAHDHHHIVCVNCKRIQDFSGCDFDTLRKRALKQAPGFVSILEHSLELFGVCSTCAKRRADQ